MRQSGMTVRIRLHGLHRLDAVGGAMGAMGVMGVMGTGRVDHLRRLRGIRRRDIVLDLTRKPCNPESDPGTKRNLQTKVTNPNDSLSII